MTKSFRSTATVAKKVNKKFRGVFKVDNQSGELKFRKSKKIIFSSQYSQMLRLLSIKRGH